MNNPLSRFSFRQAMMLALALSLVLLAGCGSLALAPTPTPVPTPEPTPTPTPPPTEAVITADMGPEEILALGQIPSLQEIDAMASREYEAICALREMLPDCRIEYQYDYKGQLLPWDTEELTVTDLEGLEEALRCLPELKKVDLLACEVGVEQMEVYSEIRPETEFLWMVTFGNGNWTVRSDITCFSTLQGGSVGIHRYTTEELYPLLRFCKRLRALDLGHNGLTDITLIGELPELQVLILGDNPYIEDISPLGNLDKVEYMEFFMGYNVQDFSPLAGMVSMVDLNMGYCPHMNDISFLDGMPNLQNVWLLGDSISGEQLAYYKELYPEALFVYGHPEEPSSMAYGWRAATRNIAIRNSFTYWRDVVEFRHWDDVDYKEGTYIYRYYNRE